MSFLRNSLSNLLGALIPAVVALLTIPVIVLQLGADQYGVLVLVTSIVGYFALLDINASAASVKYLSQFHAVGDSTRVNQVLSFGLLLYLAIGLIGGGLIIGSAETLSRAVFNIPDSIIPAAIVAIKWGGFGFAVTQLQSFLQSVFQALQRYDLNGFFEASFGTFASLTTLLVVMAGGGLVEIVQARLALSLLNCAVLSFRVHELLPALTFTFPDSQVVGKLIQFSGFAYLSKLASIAAMHSDKLFVGALVDMASVTLFAVPAMLVSRVFGTTFRLAQVMFPVASALSAQQRDRELRLIYLSATRHIVFVNSALCVLLAAFAPELLHYWAGRVFGADAVFVLVVLAFAFFVDSLTNLPSLFNDGLGRPKLTGVTAVLRATCGIFAAYIAVLGFGIRGAAVAQLAVSCIATTAFLIVVHRVSVPVKLSSFRRHSLAVSYLPFTLAAGLGVLALTRPVLPVLWFFAAFLVAAVALSAYGWLFVIDSSTQARLLGLWRNRRQVSS